MLEKKDEIFPTLKKFFDVLYGMKTTYMEESRSYTQERILFNLIPQIPVDYLQKFLLGFLIMHIGYLERFLANEQDLFIKLMKTENRSIIKHTVVGFLDSNKLLLNFNTLNILFYNSPFRNDFWKEWIMFQFKVLENNRAFHEKEQAREILYSYYGINISDNNSLRKAFWFILHLANKELLGRRF